MFFAWLVFLIVLCVIFRKKKVRTVATQTLPSVEFCLMSKDRYLFSSRDRTWRRLFKSKIEKLKTKYQNKINQSLRDFIPDQMSLPNAGFWEWLTDELEAMRLYITYDPHAERASVDMLITQTSLCLGVIKQ